MKSMRSDLCVQLESRVAARQRVYGDIITANQWSSRKVGYSFVKARVRYKNPSVSLRRHQIASFV